MKRNSKREIKTLIREVSGSRRSVASFVVAILALIGAISVNLSQASPDDSSAAGCNSSPCTMTFEVDVQESLTVSITPTETNATGDAGDFLRDSVTLNISSNVSNGFRASMYSKDTTNLVHTTLGSSTYIPTLTSSVAKGSFTADRWGYSLNDSTYYSMTTDTANPITVISATAGTKSGNQTVYFGAKASSSKAAGTYTNTVVFNVVTGTIDASTNPATPGNPVNPTTDIPNDNIATYTGSTGTGATQGVGTSGTVGTTVYTTTSTNAGITTTTTNVTGGDNTSSFASPQGVRSVEGSDSSTTQGDSFLPIGLAVTAGVAATAGTVFFVLAKKRDDDDEEEET